MQSYDRGPVSGEVERTQKTVGDQQFALAGAQISARVTPLVLAAPIPPSDLATTNRLGLQLM